MRPWSAPSPGPLWGKQPLAPEQPQDPFAADVQAVLATQPGVAKPVAGAKPQTRVTEQLPVAVAS